MPSPEKTENPVYPCLLYVCEIDERGTAAHKDGIDTVFMKIHL